MTLSSSTRWAHGALTLLLPFACGGRSGLSIDAIASGSGGMAALGGKRATGGAKSSSAGTAGFGLSSGGVSVGTGGNTQGGSGAGAAQSGGAPAHSHVTALSAGNKFTCALLSNGAVKCWGSNDFGRLGSPLAASTAAAPVQVQNITTALAISSGDQHACALSADHTIHCWGNNTYGQLGNATWTSALIPVQVSSITSAISVSAGYRHTCAIVSEGSTAYCWGDNSQGQLAGGSTLYSSNVPLKIADIYAGFSAIGAGRSHTCALPMTTLGQAICWGDNAKLQLRVDCQR